MVSWIQKKVIDMPQARQIEYGMIIFVVVGLAVLFYFGYISPQGIWTTGYPESRTPVVTTLAAIKANTFPSSLDKQGTNGTLVQVNRLLVLAVTKEIDGDYHVDVTDGKSGNLVTEFTPISRRFLNDTIPKVGMTVNLIGTPYCDAPHQNEDWHNFSCWEIHPVVAWSNSTTTLSGKFSFVPEEQDES